MRNNKYAFYLIMSIAVVFSSCDGPSGPDGKDGGAFLKISSSDGTLYLYGDDNPAIPSPFQVNQFYQASVGTYIFVYESRIYTSTTTYTYQQWLGTYTVSINHGTKGGEGQPFWQEGDPGVNGADKYFTLYCNFNGPQQSILGKNNSPINKELETSGKIKIERGQFIIDVEYRLKEKGIVTEK